jgi:hypothetical protein
VLNLGIGFSSLAHTPNATILKYRSPKKEYIAYGSFLVMPFILT